MFFLVFDVLIFIVVTFSLKISDLNLLWAKKIENILKNIMKLKENEVCLPKKLN